jgi:hypothetical protein
VSTHLVIRGDLVSKPSSERQVTFGVTNATTTHGSWMENAKRTFFVLRVNMSPKAKRDRRVRAHRMTAATAPSGKPHLLSRIACGSFTRLPLAYSPRAMFAVVLSYCLKTGAFTTTNALLAWRSTTNLRTAAPARFLSFASLELKQTVRMKAGGANV